MVRAAEFARYLPLIIPTDFKKPRCCDDWLLMLLALKVLSALALASTRAYWLLIF